MRQRAIQRAVDFVSERLNGEDGLGAIFPAMANACLMFDVLGDKAKAKIARDSLDKLLVIKDDEAYCQPCVSPVWDTALVCHTLLEVGSDEANRAGAARPRMADALAGARRRGRLDRAAAGPAPRRLGLPIRQSALSRSRRHRGGGDGHGPRPPRGRRRQRVRRRPSTARPNGSAACRARTAAGPPSTSTTSTTISTTSPSPTTAR